MAFAPELPPSKSIANRVLVKRAVAGLALPDIPSDWAEDIHAMRRVLAPSEKVDAGEAGTAFRFGMAYAAAQKGRTTRLTGSKRLLERPIEPLVRALRAMGASLDRVDDGWEILGAQLSGGDIRLDASVSSQFESALRLVEPLMHSPLTILREGHVVSSPYIALTERLTVDHWPPPADWSNALVWAMAAVMTSSEMTLKLTCDGLQGDEAWRHWGDTLGFAWDGDVIHGKASVAHWQIELNDNPDLAQPIVAAAIGLRRRATISGLSTLAHKEVNRLQALCEMLDVCAVSYEIAGATLTMDATEAELPDHHQVDVSGDHRMAMMWALLGLQTQVRLVGSESVAKSDPRFWSEWMRWCNAHQYAKPILTDDK